MKKSLAILLSSLILSYSKESLTQFPYGVYPPYNYAGPAPEENDQSKKDQYHEENYPFNLDSCRLILKGIYGQPCSYSVREKGLYFYLDCSGSEEGSLESYCSGTFCSDNLEIYFTPLNSDFYLLIEMTEEQMDEFDEHEEVIEIITEKLL